MWAYVLQFFWRFSQDAQTSAARQAWGAAVVCVQALKTSRVPPVAALSIGCASSRLEPLGQLAKGDRRSVEADDVASGQIGDRTQAAELNNDRPLRVSSEHHAKLDQDVRARLASVRDLEISLAVVVQPRMQIDHIVRR